MVASRHARMMCRRRAYGSSTIRTEEIFHHKNTLTDASVENDPQIWRWHGSLPRISILDDLTAAAEHLPSAQTTKPRPICPTITGSYAMPIDI
jgi:hypothetical protein